MTKSLTHILSGLTFPDRERVPQRGDLYCTDAAIGIGHTSNAGEGRLLDREIIRNDFRDKRIFASILGVSQTITSAGGL